MLREWRAAPGGRLASVSCQFGAPVLRNQTVVRGVVTEVREDGGDAVVSFDVWTEFDGARLAPGSATAVIPKAD